jgi:hypothetical protein
VRLAVCVVPLYVAEIVTGVEAVTLVVEMVNVALVAPAATVRLAGTTATFALLLASDTAAPADGAPLVNVTVPCAPDPPATLAGFTARLCSVAGGGGAAGGVTTSVAVLVELL